uniref:Uncharacterized protein n=1 Tax=viral metagenome TaxID=1070528 RepID=A0A6M3XLL6_9ZZZZ
MAAYTTTMSTLLTKLKAVLLLYQDTTLTKLKTWNRGVLGPAAIFPAIAILPIRESYEYALSNSKYDVIRDVSLQVFDLKFDIEQAHDNTVDLVKAIKDIFEDNHTLSGTTYSLTWGSENYGDTIEVGSKSLNRSSIVISAKSRETYPTLTVQNTITSNVNVTDLQDKIKTIMVNNKSTYYSTVNTIKDSPIKPVPKPPAILIGAGYKQRNQTTPNADMSLVFVDIAVVTHLFAKETSLNHNLSIVEGVKDVLQINNQLDGYCEYSNISYIDFEPERTKSGFIYLTTITLACKMREYL